MRPLARLATVLTLLAACQLQVPQIHAPQTSGTDAEVSALAPDAITVTTLGNTSGVVPDSGAIPSDPASTAAAVPDTATQRPAARPDVVVPLPTAPVKAAEDPAAPVSAEQALCVKSKGQWSPLAESSGFVCVHSTRDSGKSCRAKRDCQGECLAQSGTCSPIMPLMGCNAILQADGTEVTLCLQ